MHWHKFGSIIIESVLPLPTLPSPSQVAQSNITKIDWDRVDAPSDIQWCHHWLEGEEIVLSLASQGPDYWLRFPDIADFFMQLEPCRIRVSAKPSIDTATLEHILVDQILPRLLAQQGKLMVHASALAIEGRHALFMGQSGWGKSSLAGLLHRQGHTVLSDDCVQLLADGERFIAIPTYPSLRLYPDSLDELFPGLSGTTEVASYSMKRRVPMDTPREKDLDSSVSALYLLGDPVLAPENICITPLRPADICQALLRHSFRLDLSDRAANAHQFALCSEVARTVPAFRLSYPWGPAPLTELMQQITDHLASLPESRDSKHA